MRASIIIEGPQGPVIELGLSNARTSVGSGTESDILIPDSRVPALAGMLTREPRNRYSWMSREGRSSSVEPGERIELGPYALILRATKTDDGHTRTLDGGRTDRGRVMIIEGAHGVLRLSPSNACTIGTDPKATIALQDPYASRLHCRISFAGGDWRIHDLGSTNGTFLEGLRVEAARVPRRGELTLGKTRLHFEVEQDRDPAFHGMIGSSDAMRELFDRIPRLARSSEPILVQAESGCGKELVASALHSESGGRGELIAINCGGLTPTLIESELFGHVKGAFTGAIADKKGAFEAANGGTLFLDEIGELPLDLQPRLLRALESRRVRPVGSTREVPFDARIVAATHRDLQRLVADGGFRQDLFHRLFVLTVQIPPLRERPADVTLLGRSFASASRLGLSPSAEAKLVAHPWPGNVRELRNTIVRAAFSARAQTIGPEDITFVSLAAPQPSASIPGDERARLLSALEAAGGNRSEAARRLGMSKSTFFDRLRRIRSA